MFTGEELERYARDAQVGVDRAGFPGFLEQLNAFGFLLRHHTPRGGRPTWRLSAADM